MKTLYMMIGAVRVAAGYVNEETGEITLDAFPRDGRLHYEPEGGKKTPHLVWEGFKDQFGDLATGRITVIKALRDRFANGLGGAVDYFDRRFVQKDNTFSLPLDPEWPTNLLLEKMRVDRPDHRFRVEYL